MNFSVTKNGMPLDPKLYSWNKKTKTFSTMESSLVLDFSDIDGVTFKTGSDCTFKTGFCCTFDTGSRCTFKTNSFCTFDTGPRCTFKTGSDCTFKTDSDCTFDTGSGCTFKTSLHCTFKTDSFCTFDTVSGCTFKTGSDCTFDTGSGCTFETGSGCVIVRRGNIFEVIHPKEGQKIKLNVWDDPGYQVLNETKEIVIDGKIIKISKESYESLKDSLKD